MYDLKAEASFLCRERTPCGTATVVLLTAEYDPGDSSEFVGHGHADDVGVCTRFQLGQPLAEGVLIARYSMLDGSAAVNEEPSEILIAVLADPQEFRFTPSGTLLRNEAEPSREVTAFGER